MFHARHSTSQDISQYKHFGPTSIAIRFTVLLAEKRLVDQWSEGGARIENMATSILELVLLARLSLDHVVNIIPDKSRQE